MSEATIQDTKLTLAEYQTRLDELQVRNDAVLAAKDELQRAKDAVVAAEASLHDRELEAIAADDAAEKVLGKLVFQSSEFGVDVQEYVPPVDPPVPTV